MNHKELFTIILSTYVCAKLKLSLLNFKHCFIN